MMRRSKGIDWKLGMVVGVAGDGILVLLNRGPPDARSTAATDSSPLTEKLLHPYSASSESFPLARVVVRPWEMLDLKRSKLKEREREFAVRDREREIELKGDEGLWARGEKDISGCRKLVVSCCRR